MAGISAAEFDPNADITREQMAAILYRYANYKKIDTQVGDNTNILSYDDYNDISEYAIPSMQWAAGSGLMVGKQTQHLIRKTMPQEQRRQRYLCDL